MNPVTVFAITGAVMAALSLIPEWLRRWHERQHR